MMSVYGSSLLLLLMSNEWGIMYRRVEGLSIALSYTGECVSPLYSYTCSNSCFRVGTCVLLKNAVISVDVNYGGEWNVQTYVLVEF